MVTKYFVCLGKVWKEKIFSLVLLNLVCFSSVKQSLLSRNK